MNTKNEPNKQKRSSFIENARRKQIIECTIETVSSLGYSRATLAEIAKKAGISKGVIIYYFRNKEELFHQVITEVYKVAAQAVGAKLFAQQTARQMLNAYITSSIEYMKDHRAEMVALVEISSNSYVTTDGKRRFDEAWEEPILSALEALLRKGQQEGDFRDFNPRVMAIAIRRAIDAVAPLYAANPDLDVSLYAREIASLFEHATRKEAEEPVGDKI